MKYTVSAFSEDHLFLSLWDIVRLIFKGRLKVSALVIHGPGRIAK